MKANIRGTEIYFDVTGMQLIPIRGKLIEQPVLFMLHGGPGGDHLRFKQHSIDLENNAQLVFIDHRGSGRSKKTRQKDYTLENNIEDIEALRKHLGLDKICVLGTSYGGMVAQGYAIRYPHRVEKLILVATSPSYRFLNGAKATLKQRGNARQIALGEHLWNGTFKNHAHVMKFFQAMESIYSTTTRTTSHKGYSKSQTIWSHEALNEGFGGFMRRFDFIPKLKKITCPTLILAGDQDWICNPDQAKIMAKNIPHAKLKIFKNCGHSIAVDAHEQYIREIRRFLKR